MRKKHIKKEILPFDEGNFCGELLYGYTNITEAKKDYKKQTGEELDKDILQKVRVLKFKKADGEEYFFWAPVCDVCGHKNDGVPSFLHGE